MRTATWRVTDEEDGYVWRDSEAACKAWYAEARKRHAFQTMLGMDWERLDTPVDLPYCVLDRTLPIGEGRILERFPTRERAEHYVSLEGYARPSVRRPHYLVVDPDGLQDALDAPSTSTMDGAEVRLGGRGDGDGLEMIRSIEPYQKDVVPRRVETPWGAVETIVYPNGILRVSAGTQAQRVPGTDVPLNVPQTAPRDVNVTFVAVCEVRGDTADIEAVHRVIRDAKGNAVEAPAFKSLAFRISSQALRHAIREVAPTFERERLEALERHHGRRQDAADRRIAEAERLLREAEADREMARAVRLDARAALEAMGVPDPDETATPSP